MNTKEEIGQRILQERKAKGLTQAKLAELAGNLKQPRINNWEKGIRTPGHDEIIQIAKVLDVSPSYLMCLTDRKQIHPLEKNHIGALVPILDYKQACDPKFWIHSINDSSFDGNIDFIPINEKLAQTTGKYAYAVKIKDESMASELLLNDIIIISMDMEPSPGNLVVAQIDNHHEIIIRRYRQLSTTDHQFELLAINQHWPAIKNDQNCHCKLLGTVISLNRLMTTG